MINLRGLSVRTIATVFGLVFIVGGGGTYYFYVYLPEMESESSVAKHVAVPLTANKQLPKPTVAQRPPPASAASAVPAISAPVPSASAVAPAQLASNVPNNASAPSLKPDLKPVPEPVKPKPAARKATKKKPRIPAQPTRIGSVPRMPATSQPISPPLPAVLPESGVTAELAAEPKITTPKYNDILTAVLRSDKDAVRQLLALGRWIDKPGSSGLTPLMAAVMNRDAQMVQLLLEQGAEASTQALKLARKNKDVATVLLLEQHGAR